MPIVLVHGIPANIPQSKLADLLRELQKSVLLHPALALNADQVTVFLPSDLCSFRLGEEVIVMVHGLFSRPERTLEVKRGWGSTMNHIVVEFCKIHIPQFKLAEVLIFSFDPQADVCASFQN